MRGSLLIALILMALPPAFAAKGSPLRPPLRSPLRLAHDFGELRPHRFLPGIVLRTGGGRSGEPVSAAAEGYVSRIVMRHDGYGNALYLRHPDGRTTVYAHLDRFRPDLAAYAERIRQAREEEEIDLVLDASLFPVKAGQRIGWTGRSGDAEGPSLHFEVREKGGLVASDPFAAGLRCADQAAPEITGLRIYALDDKLLPLFEVDPVLRRRGAGYRVKGDTLLIGSWRAGISIGAQDLLPDGGRTGVRSIEIVADGEKVYRFEPGAIDPAMARFADAHLDYGEWVRSGRVFHRCFLLPGNPLPHYPTIRKAGLLTLGSERSREVQVTVADRAGNKRTLRFWVRRDPQAPEPEPRTFQYRIPFGEAFSREEPGIRWTIPNGALYQTTFFRFARLEDTDGTPRFQLHEPGTPLQRFMEVALQLPPGSADPGKLCAVYGAEGSWYTCGGQAVRGWLGFRTRRLGEYRLMADTTAPEIAALVAPKRYRKGTRFRLQLADDLLPTPRVRNLAWRVELNGCWLPGSWSPREGVLSIDPAAFVLPGENRLSVEAWDDRGNRRSWEHRFRH